MPTGCGTWPAAWEVDEANWPNKGEVDIVRTDQTYIVSANVNQFNTLSASHSWRARTTSSPTSRHCTPARTACNPPPAVTCPGTSQPSHTFFTPLRAGDVDRALMEQCPDFERLRCRGERKLRMRCPGLEAEQLRQVVQRRRRRVLRLRAHLFLHQGLVLGAERPHRPRRCCERRRSGQH